MVGINEDYDKLEGGYLFPEIGRIVGKFLERNPGTNVLKLGIGNTSEPLTPAVIEGLERGVKNLADVKTYRGYGDEQGEKRLREAIANNYNHRGIELDVSEIFVSDGAKPDSANIQSIFGAGNIAVQDPSYPVYVDTNVIAGRTGKFNKVTSQYEDIIYMPCNVENNFFPDVPEEKADLIYLCNPNNPTGTVATKNQLKTFVDYAIENEAVIIYDAAYQAFITDPKLPRSIYEVPEAKDCAIEINSFSKSHGFTGVRLGWSVVPKDLVVENTEPGKVNSLWNRRQTTFFNGASNIAQEGGIAALSEKGLKESQGLVNYYLRNGEIIKEGVESLGLKAYGGAPYIWMETPDKMPSWEFFDKLLEESYVVGTPGAGFGPSGEGFFRLSPHGHREDIEKAVESIVYNLKL